MTGGDGAEVIYALRNDGKLANLVLEELAKAWQNPRKAYQRRLPSDLSKDYYFMHRNTGITEPIIIEYGFLDSKGDDVNQLKNDWKKYTEGVVKAVATYIGENYEEELPGYYTVKSGDTLYSIARANNITVDELKKLNNLTSDILSIGQKLKISKTSNEVPEGLYIVKNGDTLYSIASKFNMTVDELKQLNNLSTNILSIGQELKVKETPVDITPTGLYIVKNGDTLYSIASKFNTTVDELKKLNNLSTNMLSIGMQLKIPNETNEDKPDNENYTIYIVKKGDSLYNIAKNHNTTVTEIMNINNLSTNLLNVGQSLKIPTTISGDTYTAKKGDSLWSIAKQFNITVDKLKQLNNLTTNLLSIGQVLRIK